MPLVGDPRLWKPWHKQGAIWAVLSEKPDPGHRLHCPACEATITELEPRVGCKPITFARKTRDGWVNLPTDEAKIRLRNLVYEIHAHASEWTPDAPAPEPTPEPPKPEPTPVVVETRDDASQKVATDLIRWIQQEMRPLAHRVGPDGKTLDEVGLRPAENGAKMLKAGIGLDAVKHALTLTYPPEARRALGVKAYDVTTFEPVTWGPVTVPSESRQHSGEHKAMGYVMALASVGVPVALIGPAGTGKTTLAKQLADRLNRPFGMVSMTSGTSPSAFNGRPKIGGDGGVIDSQFEKLYAGTDDHDGGVFLFDEMDASDAGLLLLVNAALANGSFANSAKGELVKRGRNFIAVCGMNTMGLGADGRFVAREKLDAATLDRWNAGRVEVKLDEALERSVFWKAVA